MAASSSTRTTQPGPDARLRACSRIPAFVGVSIVGLRLSASIFAMFLYLTLYIQDDLGYGPFAAGVRFLPLTLLAFVVAPFAGRLTVRIQSRLPPGHRHVLVIAVGLLLMCTTHPDSTWTVLLPGFIVAAPASAWSTRSGLGRRLGGRAPAQRHGLGRQQHLPTGGYRHRHRRTRCHLPEPDRQPHDSSALR